MRRVLLIGPGGFLGGHVLSLLTGEPRLWVTTASRSGFAGHGRHVQLNLGIDGPAAIGAVIVDVRPDVVINCAGATSGDADHLTAANVSGPADLVEALLWHAPRTRLIHLGSAGEYGRADPDVPLTETCRPRPVGTYGATKLAGSRLVCLGRQAGLDSLVLRVFNPIGPSSPVGSLPGRLAAELVRAKADSGDVKLGALDAVRDFVDARDVARAVLAAVDARDLRRPVLNVARGRGVSVRHLVDTLVDISGFTGKVIESENGSDRSIGVPWQQADITAIDRELGWRPEIELSTTLRDLWQAVA